MKRSNSKHSFAWLNATQFFGALNDNVFKLLVVFFLVDHLGFDHKSTIGLASLIFVVPFLLFSHTAGILADRYSKQQIIFYAKCMETALMGIGVVAILLASPIMLYALLFLMCMQSAFFGPSKFGIIPEIVKPEELSRSNSFLVGLSYLAIIIGTFVPSLFLVTIFSESYIGLATVCVGISTLGLLSSARIEETAPVGSTHQKFTLLFVVEIFKTMASLKKDRYLFSTIISMAYFLFLGAFIQQNLLVFGPEVLGWNTTTSGYLFPMAAIGIAIGALVSGKLSGRCIEFGVVPVGATGLALSCLLLGGVATSLPAILSLVFLIGISAGLFVVPLQAFIQQRSPRERLGEILACMNFLNFLGVALAAVLFLVLTKTFGMSAKGCFIVNGLVTAGLAIFAFSILPDFMVRFSILILTRIIYRIRTIGPEKIPVIGPALLVSNHVTWSDALLLSATQQRRIRFMMERDIYRSRWLNPLFRLMQVIPISVNDPPHLLKESIQTARQALNDGCLVCIFPEQRLTRNGNLQRFKPGIEHILKGTKHPLIPVYIGGGWGSVLSHYHGRLLARLPSKRVHITVVFGAPLPADTTTQAARLAVSELSKDYFDSKKTPARTLPCQFIKTARKRWFKPAIADTTGKDLAFGKTLIASILLGNEIKRITEGQDKIGLLLPSTVGGTLANIAVPLIGKIPVNLNYTASADAFTSAIAQCGIKTVITARPFIEKLAGKCPEPDGAVYIEDLFKGITSGAKIRAMLKALFVPASKLYPSRHVSPDDPATIIFSSGSTGEPKGIMLSHHNILSNVEGFRMILHINQTDRLCGVLPFFHSFGFTATLWGPLVSGFQTCYHPNPIDGATIAQMVRERKLTLLFATPTFLLTYMPKAKEEDFKSLRLIITGAEKLKQKLADKFEARFGVRPTEGYGATELSPITSVNIMDCTIAGFTQTGLKEGSVGHPIPGVAAKVVHPDSREELGENQEGLLLIKGTNVMQGYLGNPEKSAEVLQDGWYATGDIARVDSDGFIYLVDRLMRYSKIAGEMVPHLAVEEVLLQGLDAVGQIVFVTAATDERKGEQLVVLYTAEAGDAEELADLIKHSTLPNLWHPRKDNYFQIDEMPALGAGKIDMKQLKTIAKEKVEGKS
ncbi:acyl-[ACP]--phospholipid O-acyltransferase [Pontiella sulfatireligans]|uniref:Bifunctional protein Aas n=1 Tax=Pontiella sulfatireligans TaxID=2750658 RepID=A0A6C2UIE5_9BACT|nr:acyl-[ACP]--phospholipid O-acyltransferase [Pontiella sulfatireligans]VGO19898.1 Bifunctional protein Aas [Pontiella sulfatireligans]